MLCFELQKLLVSRGMEAVTLWRDDGVRRGEAGKRYVLEEKVKL